MNRLETNDIDLRQNEGKTLENIKNKWHNNDRMFEVYAVFEAGKPEYPVVCPECGQKRAHIYFNRFEETSRGGVWAWCSE